MTAKAPVLRHHGISCNLFILVLTIYSGIERGAP